MLAAQTEDLLRRLAPQVLGAVVRRYGNFDLAEDATQEALVAATAQWPRDGMPDNPKGWLITIAARRLTDLLRSDQARRRREDTVAQWANPKPQVSLPGETNPADLDDTLILLFMCCHQSLSVASQIALTLRAVGGLSTAEIARALLVPEGAVTRRITRAKRSIKDSGIPFAPPSATERAGRLDAVLRVLYLIFNEGYASTTGPELQRAEVASEAIRLARTVHMALPQDSEVTGLLALLLLTHARHRARTGPDGSLIPMSEQDRTLWDPEAIAEGVSLITDALPRGPTGPYQVQAAIAAVHDEAPSSELTDWPQIVALYEVLLGIDRNPVVALNHAVAVAMVRGPQAGLDLLADLESDTRVNDDRRFHAVRGHLLEMVGDRQAARETYEAAARRATNLRQQRYLHARAAHLVDPLSTGD
ncbi:MAG TPA: sigma-70 family RNA polymerase sigma factor [Acidimicrobiales bacterium]|nr:sigma-70 family RNA polymerase sigma factor [Acidimicrobiales bacterium]